MSTTSYNWINSACIIVSLCLLPPFIWTEKEPIYRVTLHQCVCVYLGTDNIAYSLWHGLQTNSLLQLLRKNSFVNWKTLNKPANKEEKFSHSCHKGRNKHVHTHARTHLEQGSEGASMGRGGNILVLYKQLNN